MNKNLMRGTVIWLLLVLTLVTIFVALQVLGLLSQHRAINDGYDPDRKIISEQLYQPSE